MTLKKLKDYLDSHHIKYVVIMHSTAYTAQEVAAYAHIPGKEMAKTVMVKADGRMTMAVLPATKNVQFSQLKKALGVQSVELANEKEFRDLFPDCEIGAMPPFGNYYDVPMVVSAYLAEDEEIVFNAGSHREAIRMSYRDFENLVKPKVLDF